MSDLGFLLTGAAILLLAILLIAGSSMFGSSFDSDVWKENNYFDETGDKKK